MLKQTITYVFEAKLILSDGTVDYIKFEVVENDKLNTCEKAKQELMKYLVTDCPKVECCVSIRTISRGTVLVDITKY